MNERRSDFEMVSAFARRGDQGAFAALVRRHIDLVYATAIRKVEDQGAAQEVAQNVFATLARKSWQFAPDDSVPAWLYRTTLLEAREWWRGELRRRRREETAAELGTTMKTPNEEPALRALVPLLDEALLSLREKDREALLLRFYESQSLRDLGAALGVNEDAAQKRVAGALEKLTAFFQRRGFRTATTAAVAAALQHTASSAPALVVSSLAQSALQLAPPALGILGIAARLAALTKIQTAAVCAIVIAAPVVASIRDFSRDQRALASAQKELADAAAYSETIQIEIEELVQRKARLESSLADASAWIARQSAAENDRERWKLQLRAKLLADDYRWPEDSPFVRIPKGAVTRIFVSQPVKHPGVLAQASCELFGLTPGEREQLEGSLQQHFKAMDELVDSRMCETNQPSWALNRLAAKTWFVPPLGDDATALAESLRRNVGETLGSERWQMMKAEFDRMGTDSLNRVLQLGADKGFEEVTTWIDGTPGGYTVGLSWRSPGASFSMPGAKLALFLYEAENPELPRGVNAWDYLSSRNLPYPLQSRIRNWVQEQATTLLKRSQP